MTADELAKQLGYTSATEWYKTLDNPDYIKQLSKYMEFLSIAYALGSGIEADKLDDLIERFN